MQAVRVDGNEIPPEAISAEAQNHPAASPEEAWRQAAEALVVRELLLGEARRLGIAAVPVEEDGVRETDEEALIRGLLEREITVPEADEAFCRRYYDNNRAKFRSPDIFEPAHILFAARPADKEGYGEAVARAERAIVLLTRDPGAFGDLARESSDCPSSKSGGCMGQVIRGQTVPEFETFLENLEEGQLCPVPVKTRYGAHVLRLDRRIDGRVLPFELVKDKVKAYLTGSSWHRAVAQYLRILAGRAEIGGIELNGSTTPLVQ